MKLELNKLEQENMVEQESADHKLLDAMHLQPCLHSIQQLLWPLKPSHRHRSTTYKHDQTRKEPPHQRAVGFSFAALSLW